MTSAVARGEVFVGLSRLIDDAEGDAVERNWQKGRKLNHTLGAPIKIVHTIKAVSSKAHITTRGLKRASL
jgi:hypothetical protein